MTSILESETLHIDRLEQSTFKVLEGYARVEPMKVYDRLKEILKMLMEGKHLDDEAKVFRLLREYVVASLVFYASLREGDDELVKGDLDNICWHYLERLQGTEQDIAWSLADYCYEQAEEAEKSEGNTQQQWIRVFEAVKKHFERTSGMKFDEI